MAQRFDNSKTDAHFTNTYRSLYPFILRYCIAKLKGSVEDAEECTQEAFYILYRKYCSGVEIENPKAFLIKTANNIIMKKVAAKHGDTYYFDDIDIDVSKDEHGYSKIEYSELLCIINNRLNEPDKTIFNLRYVEEKSVREISEITGISITNITTRIWRFRSIVQTEINKWRR